MKKVDVFPAIVLIAPPDSIADFRTLSRRSERPANTRRVDRSRVAIVNDRIHVVVDSPEGPRLVFREQIVQYERTPDKTHHAVTAKGKILSFFKDENCGCGSRLRSWNPFGAINDSLGDPDA